MVSPTLGWHCFPVHMGIIITFTELTVIWISPVLTTRNIWSLFVMARRCFWVIFEHSASFSLTQWAYFPRKDNYQYCMLLLMHWHFYHKSFKSCWRVCSIFVFTEHLQIRSPVAERHWLGPHWVCGCGQVQESCGDPEWQHLPPASRHAEIYQCAWFPGTGAGQEQCHQYEQGESPVWGKLK